MYIVYFSCYLLGLNSYNQESAPDYPSNIDIRIRLKILEILMLFKVHIQTVFIQITSDIILSIHFYPCNILQSFLGFRV